MEQTGRNAVDEKNGKTLYRSEAVSETISMLESHHFSWISDLGFGTFGTVIEIENTVTHKRVAAKIVLEENLKDSERKLWPLLIHDNVLPVIDCHHLTQAHTWVFLMPKHRSSLTNIIESPMLHTAEKGLELALSWLEDVLNGVSYLHQQHLCHLDIKPDNVLISDSGSAVISDFGSLTRTDAGVDTYASPLIYCPPEAMRLKSGKKVVVDGFKYDMYTVGVLAIELLTKHRIIRGATARGDRNPDWISIMYPIIFNILKEKEFKNYVKASFLKADVKSENVKGMRNFITACINLNPQNRPRVEQALQHRIFGGSVEFEANANDAWKMKASPKKLHFMISLFIGRAATLKLTSDSLTPFQAKNEESEVASLVNESKCKGDNEVSDEEKIHMNKEKDFSGVIPKTEMTRKQHILNWTKRTKSSIVKIFSRLMPTFQRK